MAAHILYTHQVWNFKSYTNSNTLSQDATLNRIEKIATIKEEFKQASNDIAFGTDHEADRANDREEALEKNQTLQSEINEFSI